MAPQETSRSFCRLALAGRLVLPGLLLGGSPAFVSLTAAPADHPAVEETKRLNPAEAGERIDALRTEIAYHDELYFKKSAPVISDQAYDRLKRELAALEQAFPEAARQGVPLAAVGDDRTGAFATCRHRVRMLSLNKSYTEAELRAFDTRLAGQLGAKELEYVVEPKFDGLAISVTYEKGRLIRAVTRGDGEAGNDVTGNVLAIHALPRVLRATASDGTANVIPEVIELRGEIYIGWTEFARINRERENAGDAPFANPRNLAAGTLLQLDVQEVRQRRLEIVFYGYGACEPATACPDSQIALLHQLQRWDLPTVVSPKVVQGADAMWNAVQAIGRERTGYPFPTDGAVVKLNSAASQGRMGATSQAPLWAMAYKFAPERIETQLRAITLQVGRTGVLTPVAELVPVRLGGSSVARASLYNRDEITRRDIRVGDFVYVEKAGEIIPAIAGVNLSRRSVDSRPYVFPTACPECAAGLAGAVGEAAVRCPNESCPAQVRRRVEYFASSGCVHLAGLGPAMIGKLVAAGCIKNVADLYRLRRTDLVTSGTATAGSADRILAAIEKSKHAELWRIVRGLGIPQVGEVAARELARRFAGLEALAAVQRRDLFPGGKAPVAGLSETAASAVLEYFTQPSHRALVEDFQMLGVKPVAGSAEPKAP